MVACDRNSTSLEFVHVLSNNVVVVVRFCSRAKVCVDYNEYRKKNQVKTVVATNALLASLGSHLFGAEGVLSNRKVLGLLLRSAGLGQVKENNGV